MEMFLSRIFLVYYFLNLYRLELNTTQDSQSKIYYIPLFDYSKLKARESISAFIYHDIE